MNENKRPTPVPRPRQRGANNNNSPANVENYENVEILNNNLVSVIEDDSNDEKRPVPAPRRPKLSVGHSAEEVQYVNLTKATGAIRKVPGKLNNDLRPSNNNDLSYVREEDNVSIGSSDSGRRYKTSSPGQIFKSIGATSKLLTESITERVVLKKDSVKHKIDKNIQMSKDMISNWGAETGKTAASKLKNVRKSLNIISPENLHMSLNRKNKTKRSKSETGDDIFERRQTAPLASNDEIFNHIQFHLTLNDKTPNKEDLRKIDASTYEIPKSNKVANLEEPLPSYDDVVTKMNFSSKSNSSVSLASSSSNTNSSGFQRNSNLTQSLYTQVVPKKEREEAVLREKIKSESNLFDPRFLRDKSLSSSEENIPCPSFPAPVLTNTERPEGHYGKLNIVAEVSTSSSEEDNNISRSSPRVNIRKKVNLIDTPPDSTRATFDSTDADDLRIFSRRISELNINDRTLKSETWTFYDTTANNDSDGSSPEPIYTNQDASLYGQVCEMESQMLKPTRFSLKINSADYDEVCITDIIDEFDPLADQRTVDGKIKVGGKSNELLLLECILGAEDYGSLPDNIPLPPTRVDSLYPTLENELPPIPAPKLKKKNSVIIHQNLHLPSGSVSDLLDEAEIEKHLAKIEEKPLNLDVDYSYNSNTPAAQSSWYVSDESNAKPDKSSRNEKKISKTSMESDEELPTYNEAIADSNPVTLDKESCQSHLKNSVKSMFSNVLNLKRKSSIKGSKSDVKTVLEMVPKPLLSEKLIYHRGHLLKFPSGMMEDILNELCPRACILQERKILTFLDPQQTVPKETIHLSYVVSIQCVLNHKFNNEGGIDIHCFEIILAIPKTQVGNQQLMSTNPNMMITSASSGNMKAQRQSYIFGIHKKADRNLWMMKLLQSLTDVFPAAYASEYSRAGWCYMKKSISSEWSGAWILLSKRRLLFHNFTDCKLEMIDLRKARCIGSNDSDESIKNLHIESGSTVFLDCPPYTTLYFIMNSPRETQIWRKIIKDVAHSNGNTLRHQQLTKNDIPVLVDKCINFIYAHGSMSEGIYRKSGSVNQVSKLLTLFRQDAFSVQITRTEYNEHDVSSALKKFLRELPETFLGKLSVSFISVSALESETEKILAYKELLERLPKIEYQTLKKLLGHLHFIQSLRKHNKMDVTNLAMIWGPTLMQNQGSDNVMMYSQEEAEVISDLVINYKNLFKITPEETHKEQLMLAVLQKYHAAAENLSDSVKKSGDLKVWITVDCTPDKTGDEKLQLNVTINPTKTAFDVCKELAPKTNLEAHKLTLYEVILNGKLTRPIHFSEKVLDIVLRWSYWAESDRKSNYLLLKPTKLLNDVLRTIQKTPTLTPTTDLKYADKKTKHLKTYQVQFFDGNITIMKKIEGKKEKDVDTIKCKEVIDVKRMVAYLGVEGKRDGNIRWAITLVNADFKLRTKDSPYIGRVLGGIDFTDQMLWYSSILHGLYKDNILPNAEMIIP